MRYKEPRIGHTGQKVLLLLLAGTVIGLATSPRGQFRILKSVQKDWERINRRALYQSIRNLYKSNLVDAKDNTDGTTTFILNKSGKQKALSYKLEEMKIPPMKKWDNKWRLIIFDIPEKYKKGRDALAKTLKNMGCYSFQKSVFIHPFECENEIDFVVEFFNLRPYVRFIVAERIDNELHLKKLFKLS